MKKIFFSLILLTLTIAADGQTGAVNRNEPETEMPPARNQPAIAYDDRRGVMILLGGIDQSGKALNDTWEWDGKNWRRVAVDSSPAPRTAHAVAFDAKRSKLVLFGGQAGANALDDTWEFDGKNWTKIEPRRAPPPRVAHSLVYDSKRGQIVLFGGTNFATRQTFNDTWTWDGANWTEIKTQSAPDGRFHFGMTFDAVRGRLVLFGGNSAVPPFNSEKFKAGQRDDTWEFDGREWRRILPPNAPPKRDHTVLAYDAKAKKAILFGGFSGGFEDGIYHGDTWTWDGKNWKRVENEPSPSARGGKPGMAFDSINKRLVLFGGGTPQKALNDLWFFAAGKWLEGK